MFESESFWDTRTIPRLILGLVVLLRIPKCLLVLDVFGFPEVYLFWGTPTWVDQATWLVNLHPEVRRWRCPACGSKKQVLPRTWPIQPFSYPKMYTPQIWWIPSCTPLKISPAVFTPAFSPWGRWTGEFAPLALAGTTHLDRTYAWTPKMPGAAPRPWTLGFGDGWNPTTYKILAIKCHRWWNSWCWLGDGFVKLDYHCSMVFLAHDEVSSLTRGLNYGDIIYVYIYI